MLKRPAIGQSVVSVVTDEGGFVVHAVAEGSQPGRLQQLVDAEAQALLEGREALHHPGCVSINQHGPLNTRRQG